MTIKEFVEKMPTRKLKSYVIDLYNHIYSDEGSYGSKDLLILDRGFEELEKRGWEVIPKGSLIFIKK